MVSVLPAKQPGLEAAIISTPLGGYLAPGMELRIDKGRPARLLYETCNQAGCHGGFALTGRMREALFNGKRLQVRLWTAKEKPVDVEVSLNGLAPAAKALAEAADARPLVGPRYEMIEENWVRFAKIISSRIIQNDDVFVLPGAVPQHLVA
jgi:Invasion associated locus B (IalB) protein